MSRVVSFKLLVQGIVPAGKANNAFAEAVTAAVERALQEDCSRFGADLGTLQIRIEPIAEDGVEIVHTRSTPTGEKA